MLRSIRDGGMTLVGMERSSGQNVIVFGATGRSGRAVVARLLERGPFGHGLRSKPRKDRGRKDEVRIATGDVLDAATVEPAVQGHDAVISCLGAGLKGTVRSEGTRNIITAMHAAGVRRLISQSSLGVGDSRQNLNAFWKYPDVRYAPAKRVPGSPHPGTICPRKRSRLDDPPAGCPDGRTGDGGLCARVSVQGAENLTQAVGRRPRRFRGAGTGETTVHRCGTGLSYREVQ
jgi:NAD(P)-dependent dehydrogenase (short-subunit alcohol dehydrogenase family)